jgi:hypothetical protein
MIQVASPSASMMSQCATMVTVPEAAAAVMTHPAVPMPTLILTVTMIRLSLQPLTSMYIPSTLAILPLMPLAPHWPHVATTTAAAMATAMLTKPTTIASAAPTTPLALPLTSMPMPPPLAILTLALSPSSVKGPIYLTTIATASILTPLTIADLI